MPGREASAGEQGPGERTNPYYPRATRTKLVPVFPTVMATRTHAYNLRIVMIRTEIGADQALCGRCLVLAYEPTPATSAVRLLLA